MLSERRLTGRDSTALEDVGSGLLLAREAAAAFARLAADARGAGFDLRIASAWRSFERQLAIFNGKACGERPVVDDEGRTCDLAALDVEARIHAILRYSALPGGSRHHWGTDIDVFDAACLPEGYRLALSTAEVAPGGLFDPLHCWLDARIDAGESHGFYRPYDRDRGGVAPERWHLSFAPLALRCQDQVDAQVLERCWEQPCAAQLCWRDELLARLPELVERYLRRVAPAPDWAQRPGLSRV
jgi:LAS superfamily LD-carboxypeptidase LdcB